MTDFKDVFSAIKDAFISPIKEAIEYRAKSNFFGSLIISWSIWNWKKIIYFIFSDDSVINKIINVTSIDFLSNDFLGLELISKSTIIAPLSFAIFYTLLHPIFTWLLSMIHRKVMDELYHFNVSVEHSRLDLKKTSLSDTMELESLKSIKQSEAELTVAQNKEATTKALYDIEQLIKNATKQTVIIENARRDLTSIESRINAQEKRRDSITEEINILNEKLGPLEKHQGIINDLNEKLSESHDINEKMHEEKRITARLESSNQQDFNMMYNVYEDLLVKCEAASDTLLTVLGKIREEESNNRQISHEIKELINDAYGKVEKTTLPRFTHPNKRH
ncbi:Uncharacterised protein [Raoultella terrigena]|uniref:Uncharacterized protein n=1 Tax=Raoultella terrigena TaxID=577 RepID=A0A4U9DCD4_RAOTE|nr:Uncharacterised protein [Raoultella terrigena]